MAIYLGNLTTEQIAKRLGIELTPEEKAELDSFHEDTTEKVRNRFCWHCYDIPFVIACGNYEAAVRVRDIFQKYEVDMNGQLQISGDWDGSPEPDKASAMKQKLYTEALTVSRRIDKKDGNLDALNGAWQALTTVIDGCGLLSDFNLWRDRKFREQQLSKA